MSLNDFSMGTQGVDVHPGVTNPTSSNNNANPMAANDVKPTIPTERGKAFAGMPADTRREAGVVEARPGIIESTRIEPLAKESQSKAGVIEARPGIIETTDIDPLTKKDSNSTTSSSVLGSVSSSATGAVKQAYDTLVGNK